MERREVESAEAARQRSARLILVGTYGKGSFRSAIPSSAPRIFWNVAIMPNGATGQGSTSTAGTLWVTDEAGTTQSLTARMVPVKLFAIGKQS